MDEVNKYSLPCTILDEYYLVIIIHAGELSAMLIRLLELRMKILMLYAYVAVKRAFATIAVWHLFERAAFYPPNALLGQAIDHTIITSIQWQDSQYPRVQGHAPPQTPH